MTGVSCLDHLYLFEPEPKPELEEKPQNLTESIDNKKQKKPKKMLTTHTSITGFEKAFEQFATARVQDSQEDVDMDSEVGGPSTPKQTELPQENQLDVSAAQVSLENILSNNPEKTPECAGRSFFMESFFSFGQTCFSKMKIPTEVKKSRRHPLSKPPMRSPLSILKQDPAPDKGVSQHSFLCPFFSFLKKRPSRISGRRPFNK